jgi:hypothetical protein
VNSPSSRNSPKGLLLVTMEPPAVLEEEFNDWYDTEHFPQRRALPGFESASRWACIDGWPRWLALYDLTSTAAVETDAYRAVSGAQSTPWSRRILPKTCGRMRVVAEQVAPGQALSLPPADVSRLLLARFAVPAAARQDGFIGAVMKAADGIPGLRQLRAFCSGGNRDSVWAIAELAWPTATDTLRAGLGQVDGVGADLFNLYVPYWRG